MRILRLGATRQLLRNAAPASPQPIIVPRSAVDPCGGVVCPPNMHCDNGACVPNPDPCGGVVCPPPLSCVDGACLDVSCIGVVCPPGSLCRDGACLPTSTGPRPAETIIVPVSATAPRATMPRDTRFVVPPSAAPAPAPAPMRPAPVIATATAPTPSAALTFPTYDPGPAPEQPQTHSQPTDAEVVPIPAKSSALGWAVGLFFLGKALAFF